MSNRRALAAGAAFGFVVLFLIAGLRWIQSNTTDGPPLQFFGSHEFGGADRGRHIAVARGTIISVSLNSYAWEFELSPNTGALLIQATHYYQAPQCVPGSRCGCSNATLLAQHTGTTLITATRRSCGEAMPCVASNSQWALLVDVR